MGRAVSARFQPGDRVLVKMEDRPGHIRTPWYVRGKRGWIERVYGEFRNPESLAYGGDGMPKRPLYLVGFDQSQVWEKYSARKDKLFIDIYEHWLEPTE
jgi:nitrile hydratase subunit beta